MRATLAATGLLLIAAPAGADEFDAVRPFVQTYCSQCHGNDKPKGDVNLTADVTPAGVAKSHRQWTAVVEQLRAGEMPPERAKQPPAEDRRKVADAVESLLRREAARTAGDPGPVPPRRLSNAEYDHTIRDLTGFDLRPTKEFPVDPANEAGFDNSAESLTMSPALLKKYLEAARFVADHLVLAPDGLAFAPHPVVTDTDRDKYCVNRVIAFYRRQPTDPADYFYAAWRYRQRAGSSNLAEVAAEEKVSPKYLTTVWNALTEGPEEVGPVAAVRKMFDELPADPTAARQGCVAIRDFVAGLRSRLVPEVKNLTVPSIHNGAQCLVLWKNRQYAANRMRYAGGGKDVGDVGLPAGSAAAKAMVPPTDDTASKGYEACFERFCRTFPDAFYVSERARVYLNPEKEKKLSGRLLNAGFHSMTGYFRDDGPLSELILDDAGRRELDKLWEEFDFVTNAPVRQYTSFVWFERTDSGYMRDPEFDFARAEDKGVTAAPMIRRLSEVYLTKALSKGASETAQQAIRDYFAGMSATIRRVEDSRVAAEPKHLLALQDFAERAYRRPLTVTERNGVAEFYRRLRRTDGLTHEEAVRDTLAMVLVSPHFCYRIDKAVGPTANGVQRLSDYSVANRLSYFLWASTPDAELLSRAAAGGLRNPAVLAAQTRRMLRDPKARGLATEFAGHWLDFRRFEEHNSVDRTRFPAFDNDLRQAMFEEPVRFFQDVTKEDRSVFEFLDAKHTFVNPVLARFYGMPAPADGWVRVDDADKYGRGGLLPMAVFLTQNSPGLRTSPVKRGYWVVRRLLGEHIPPPPTEVPELPADEAKLGERTLREVLASHRAHVSCAGCHDRFDAIGVAFEGFGPVGERRLKDLGGRPVEDAATFPNGGDGVGVPGLKAYLREKRRAEFVDNLCRKLLAYGLGRGLLLSDEGTVAAMKEKLAAEGHRFGALVEAVVTSPQFLNKRTEGGP